MPLKRHWTIAAVLLVYAAFVVPQLGRGIASVDAHGIVNVVQNMSNGRGIEMSRPPGHPTTEIYLFGSIAWLLKHALHRPFSDETYLILQFLGGATAALLFYSLLIALKASTWRAALLVGCLVLSPQYLLNSFDGEEYVFAIALLLIAIRLLVVLPNSEEYPSFNRVYLSIFAFALATGCRAEVAIAGVMYPVLSRSHPGFTAKRSLQSLGILALAITLIWSPIFIAKGMILPTGSGMSFVQSLLGAGYKFTFLYCTLPVFLILIWGLFKEGIGFRLKIKQLFPSGFLLALSFLVVFLSIGSLLWHPEKPAYALYAYPFILILTMNRSGLWLASLSIATLGGCFVGIDIFRDRVISRPFFTAGSYGQAASSKPASKLDYLESTTKRIHVAPTVTVANAWTWDFAYQCERKKLSLREEIVASPDGTDVPAFHTDNDDHSIVLPREAVASRGLLGRYAAAGYSIEMDSKLFRSVFWKYNVTSPLSETASVDGVPVKLF